MKACWKTGHQDERLLRHASYAPARRAINLALARSMLSRISGLSHPSGSSFEEKKEEGGSAVSCEIPRTCIFRGVSKDSKDDELLGAKSAEAEAYEVEVEAGGDVEGM